MHIFFAGKKSAFIVNFFFFFFIIGSLKSIAPVISRLWVKFRALADYV